jgi:hypothetical protein
MQVTEKAFTYYAVSDVSGLVHKMRVPARWTAKEVADKYPHHDVFWALSRGYNVLTRPDGLVKGPAVLYISPSGDAEDLHVVEGIPKDDADAKRMIAAVVDAALASE